MIYEKYPYWDIDVESGTIFNLKLKRNVGVVNKYGYLQISYNLLHRVIWMVANQAEIPDGYDVHHINGDRLDNRICNLELVKHSEHISEHKQNISEDTRVKLSNAMKGKTPINKGKKISFEIKKKISEGCKGKKKHYKGTNK